MTKVRIRNFQSIGDIELVIDGFTVIVGKSDIGKSAVIRSIDAALSNQSGDGFIRNGQTSTTVNINYKDVDIEWKKKGSTSYQINGESFSKLNRSVPKPLTDMGFKKLEVGTQKLNPLIATQFEPLFLLDKPGSVITEVLSTLYKLNILSSADDLCQKELKSTKFLLKTRENDLTEIEKKLESYKDFDYIKELIQHLIKEEKKSIESKKEIAELSIYEKDLLDASIKIKKLSGIDGVIIPDTKVLEELLLITKWLSEKTAILQESIKSVKFLRDMSAIPVPEYYKGEGLIKELIQVQEWENKVINSTGIVKKTEDALSIEFIKDLSTVTIPGYVKIDGLIKELVQVQEWENTIKNSINIIKKIEKSLSLTDLSPLTNKADKIEEIIKSASDILEIENEFTLVAQSARKARDELSNIEKELLSAKEEEIKEKELLGGVCPTCGQTI